jgi:long-chain fatty acid transport protein
VFRPTLSLVLLFASTALASVPEIYGDGARATAMGGTGAASANDGSASFYNPSLLVLRRTPVMTVNTAVTYSKGDFRSLEADRPVDTTYAESPTFVGAGIGLVLPLGGKLKDRLALGLDLYAPATRLVRARAPDPSQPYLHLHHNMPERMVAAVGVGLKVVDQFTLGAGALVLADLDGAGASVTMDLANAGISKRDIDSGLDTKATPILGMTILPGAGFQLGLSYRGELDQVNHIPATIHLGELATIGMDIRMRNHWTPHTFTAAASWSPSPQLVMSVDAIYGMWSRAPTPYTQIVVDISGDLLDGLGLGDLLDQEAVSGPPGFKDTLSVRAGVEVEAADFLHLRFGGGFRPTPVPQQSTVNGEAPTNILDGNTVLFSGGVGFRFDDPLELFPNPLRLDFAAHLSVLLPREAYKNPEDPSPSYRYSGMAGGGMASLRYDF